MKISKPTNTSFQHGLKVRAVNLISEAAPFLAPVSTAYLIGEASHRVLNFPTVFAVCAALAVEFLGVSISDTVITLYQFNRAKRKIDPPAPLSLSIAILFLYVSVAILLTVFLERAQALSKAVFPFLSLTGILTLALRSDHARRLEEIANEKALRREISATRQAERKAQRKVSVKRFQCAQCDFSHSTQQGLAAHLRKHLREAELVIDGNGHREPSELINTFNKGEHK